jgi:hypothetical protein
MGRKKLIFILVTCILLPFSQKLAAQEALKPLLVNSKLQKSNLSNKKAFKSAINSLSATSTLELPFFEDFSTYTGFPDSKKWADKKAYVNSTFAKNMISIGVATLDAIDENGAIYPDASLGSSADTLTSLPINLNYKGRDDIYFSFFYQPAGISEAPDSADYLFLDFFNVSQSKWDTVWYTQGSKLSDFRQVLIQISDTSYQKSGFRFRFRNMVSISNSFDEPAKRSNADIWNIDYIKLDTGRSAADTVLHDVSVTKPQSSLFSSYTSMPCNHFLNAYITQLNSTINMTYRNNDTSTVAVSRYFRIKDLYVAAEDGPTFIEAGVNNIEPDSVMTIQKSLPNPFSTIDSQTDSATFEVKAYLGTNDLDYFKGNDTIYFYQQFKNYMSYDDGSAEGGWGLQGQGAESGYVAYGFKSYDTDTLVGVSMYFNSTEDSINLEYFFKLAVWDDNNNWPNNRLLYMSDDSYSPQLTGLNKFYEYALSEHVVLKSSQRFYIGWYQVPSSNSYDPFLNVGMDLNNDSKANLYYNLGTGWVKSIAPGALMMRPIFKKMTSTSTSVSQVSQNKLSVYPNPASDKIYFATENNEVTMVSIFDIRGRKILQRAVTDNQMDVSELASGLYLLQISSEKTTFASTKLLIQH